jgi:hypothetical protein
LRHAPEFIIYKNTPNIFLFLFATHNQLNYLIENYLFLHIPTEIHSFFCQSVKLFYQLNLKYIQTYHMKEKSERKQSISLNG